jgi:hypothetical protein
MNLVEAHLLSALRREHQVRMVHIREALKYLVHNFPSHHPLADQQFETDGLSIFIQRYGELITISQDGQLAMREVLETYLRRIERDMAGTMVRALSKIRRLATNHPPPFIARIAKSGTVSLIPLRQQ